MMWSDFFKVTHSDHSVENGLSGASDYAEAYFSHPGERRW